VLLIEDNAWHAGLVGHALTHAPTSTPEVPAFELIVHETLGAGIEALASREFDIVVLDLELPDAEGVTAISEVRTFAPMIPIVVLTGTNDDLLALDALRQGAQDYLVKGKADANLLVRSLRYAIERKRAEETLSRTQWLAGIGETVLTMQHEINNPLSVLLANAEFLSTAGATAEQSEMVGAIVDSAWRIAAVVQHLGELKDPSAVAYVNGRRILDIGAKEAAIANRSRAGAS
jgi:CheY-like chemotaxis protein